MKKVLAIVLAALMVLSLSACGSGEATNGDSGDKTLKAAIVFSSAMADGSWNADCYEGMKILESDYGYEIAYTENVESADYVKAFRDYAAAGYDLVIGPGAEFEDAIKEVYEEFPDTHFAGINFTFCDKNVTALHHDNAQAGFLFAALAGLMTKTNSVGYIYSLDIQPMLDSMEGAKQGVEYVNPGCKLSIASTGSFTDVAKGKELALSQITTADVDVIMPFAAACGIGVLEACEEKGCHMVYGPIDGLEYSDMIHGCVILSNSGVIEKIGQMVAEGIDEGIFFEGNCANGIVRYGSMSDEVPQEVLDKIYEIQAGLADGSITIEK